LGPSLRKRTENYECKFKGASAYLFRLRKGVTTHYKFKIAFKYHRHQKIQKNKIKLLLMNGLTTPV
jgi:hypothetical protein